MGSVEWNKKEELVAEQALKHLKVRSYPSFFICCYCYLTVYWQECTLILIVIMGV